MDIRTQSVDRNLLLEFSGELDHHAAKNAIRELELAVDTALPRRLVLDFNGVTFMDSSGIALLLRAKRCMDALVVGRLDDAVLLAFGQHDGLLVALGLAEQAELEVYGQLGNCTVAAGKAVHGCAGGQPFGLPRTAAGKTCYGRGRN